MPKKILIVDDEKDLVDLIQKRLASFGYEVLTAFDGWEALDKARQEKPDLVLLDLMLPKVDGYGVCRILKFDERYKDMIIVMFTVRDQDSDAALGYRTGADAYMTKPFKLNVLLGKIEELLGAKKVSA